MQAKITATGIIKIEAESIPECYAILNILEGKTIPQWLAVSTLNTHSQFKASDNITANQLSEMTEKHLRD